MPTLNDNQVRQKLAELEAAVNGASSCLNDQSHSRLNLVGEGLLSTFYEFIDLLQAQEYD